MKQKKTSKKLVSDGPSDRRFCGMIHRDGVHHLICHQWHMWGSLFANCCYIVEHHTCRDNLASPLRLDPQTTEVPAGLENSKGHLDPHPACA